MSLFFSLLHSIRTVQISPSHYRDEVKKGMKSQEGGPSKRTPNVSSPENFTQGFGSSVFCAEIDHLLSWLEFVVLRSFIFHIWSNFKFEVFCYIEIDSYQERGPPYMILISRQGWNYTHSQAWKLKELYSLLSMQSFTNELISFLKNAQDYSDCRGHKKWN